MHTLERHHEWQAASLYLHEQGAFVPLARLDEKLVEPAFLATGTDGRFVQVAAKTRHATYFYQNDHLGTPQEMVDESGKVVWLARYKAWRGVKRAPYGNVDPVGVDNRIRFQGQYHDEETGLAYNRHRYYDPQNGRFISKDPIGLAGGVNVYAYAPNPVGWIDPLGLNKYIPAPASLPGFPDAVVTKRKTPVQGGGMLRKRWRLPDGCICEWDSQHGEVEKYNKRGRHLGAFDPNTGDSIFGKVADSTRRIEP
ncbi:hypothetical protein HHL14_32475 [Paraburkholderia sp. G-4-1-8]|uniref:RHS repeat-associated core domain-containing protein n=2 Tax=Paraburkholderia antibiotica TaxID=2728839 RepID=A0A7Y0A2W3_9BURK|nr:hypothetical protein [Paraburkholderia antibiotica]